MPMWLKLNLGPALLRVEILPENLGRNVLGKKCGHFLKS